MARTTHEDPSAEVRALLAQRTGTDPADWFLVVKARHGMAVLAEVLAEVRGPGTVLTQILTCATAVDPFLVAGLRPVHGEISRDSLALDPDVLDVPDDLRALVVQHTFGLVDERRAVALRDAARTAGAVLVEDSAHCVGTFARDAAGEPLADVSVHSFGVEKMLPTRFGGALWVNPAAADARVRARLVERLAALGPASVRTDLVTRAYRTQVGVLNRLPGPIARPLRSALVRARLLDPPIAPVEVRGGVAGPATRPTSWVLTRAVEALRGLGREEERRAAAVDVYLDALGDLVEVPAAAHGRRALVRFPFLVAHGDDAESVVAGLQAAGHHGGRWYRPALFPGVEDPALYGWTPGDPALAVSEDVVARVVNLPTRVDVDEARRIAATVRGLLGA